MQKVSTSHTAYFFLLTPYIVEAVLGAENGLLPRGQVLCANFLSGNMLEIEPASVERPEILLHRRDSEVNCSRL